MFCSYEEGPSGASGSSNNPGHGLAGTSLLPATPKNEPDWSATLTETTTSTSSPHPRPILSATEEEEKIIYDEVRWLRSLRCTWEKSQAHKRSE